MTPACPHCRRSELEPFVSREALAEEIALRAPFYGPRIDGKLDPAEKKDRFAVSHAACAELRLCRDCGIVVRIEDDAPDFEEEPYAPYVMERMLRAHAEAYRKKAPVYRALLPEGAQVVEVGSYVGGFLQVAGEWGWKATGVDVGHDTARFTRAHAYATRDGALEDAGFDDASVDAVFIWNCFEQLEPAPLLAEARRILRDGGLLVLRVPNVLHYAACQALLPRPADLHHPIVIALGHANLLGWPHLYGYSAASLERVTRPHAFARERLVSARHINPTPGRFTLPAIREEERLEGTLGALDHAFAALAPESVAGPWLEAVYRAVT